MANALGFPPSAEKERNRVRKKLNPQGRGILTEMAAPAAQPQAISDPFTEGLPRAEVERLAALRSAPQAKTAPAPNPPADPAAQGRHLGSIAGPYTAGPRIEAPAETPATPAATARTPQAPVINASLVQAAEPDASPILTNLGQPPNTSVRIDAPQLQTATVARPNTFDEHLAPLQGRSADKALLAGAYAGGAAGRDMRRYRADIADASRRDEMEQTQADLDIAAPLTQAKVDYYQAGAEKDRALSSPEALAAQGLEGQREMMTKLIGTNESLYTSILQNLKDSPEASKYTPQQLTQLAREEAWKSTLDTFQRVSGLFTDAQGNETEGGRRLKEGFEAYRRALVNLDQRRDSGQLDEKAYNKEYRALNQKWMDIRDAQKKTPTITS